VPFNGPCLISRAGINSIDGLVHFELKAIDGTFDWTPFVAKPEQSREILAMALAAITSNKNIHIQTNDTKAWSEIWWFDVVK
jgi:hypothetical protein